MRATVYHKTILDVGCPEILIQCHTFHVWIGGAVVVLWRQKQVAAGNLNVPVGLQGNSSSQNSRKGSSSELTERQQLFSELTERQQLSKRHRAK